MTWSFSIGRLFGSELRVHATFFLLLLWIGVAAYLEGGLPSAIVNVLFILALFACVVAHEFGHALMARRYGIRTPDITLLPIGGMARLERMPEKPAQEIAVAVAGPAVNIVIFLVLVAVFGIGSDLSSLDAVADPAQGFFGRLAAVNLFLVIFNMIPAFPMDGGRVFRALLATRMDRVRATAIAARAGQVLAFVFGFLGLTGGNPILLLIAIFVFAAAAAESSDVALRSMASNLPASAAMITGYEALTPADPLERAGEALLRTTQHEFPVLTPEGALAGILTRTALFQAVSREAPPETVGEIMTRDVPAVGAWTPLTGALDLLYRDAAPAVAVTGRGGDFVGYITRENVGELMILQEHRRGHRGPAPAAR